MLCNKCRVTMLCEDEKELRCRLEWKRVVARNTKFTAICNKFTPLQLFFWGGAQLKKLHFVLAKCLKWRRNHDPYSTKTTSNFICSKWELGKTGIFKDEMEKNMMKTFNPAGLLQAPSPCLYVHVCFKRMNPHTYHNLSSYMGLA